MKITVELSPGLLGTSVRRMEKQASDMDDAASPEEIATYLYKIAEQHPLHVMAWEIEKQGKVIAGTYRGDSETDSYAAMESDIAALLEE